MNAQPQEKVKITPEEYLKLERSSKIKHEYFDGEVFAMVGAKKNHNLINTNIIMELGGKLKAAGSTCRVFSNDMRVKVKENGKYTYPDIVVACGNIEMEDEAVDTLMNPIAIIEILSDSTEAYDRGKKFEHYQCINSFQEYILIAQDRCRIEKYVRSENDTWVYSSCDDMEKSIKMESIDCELSLSEIYWHIALGSPTD